MKHLLIFFFIFNCSLISDTRAVRVKFEKKAWNHQAGLMMFEKDGAKVTFISAIHIAPRAYYESLNKLFKSYEAVLYEGVLGYQEALKNNKVDSPWDVIALKLNLKTQLNSINYKATNFIHADLSFKELLEKDKINKTDILDLQKMSQITAAFKQAPKDVLMKFYRNIFKREELKNPLIITHRNVRCLEVLSKQLGSKKNIAIFYGAAHFKDMKTRLEESGFKQTKTSWLTVFKE